MLAVNTDVTEKKRLATQFLRTQRVESLGTLASGIAHDLNNAMTPILGGAQILRQRLAKEDDRMLLDMMVLGAERSADMVRQLLAFARGADGARMLLQVKHVVKDIRSILEKTIPKSIGIETFVDPELWPIMGDATQLHQVLMNLCLNARDAMQGSGKLSVRAENVELDENYSRMCRDAKAGRFVCVTVGDTGTGIASEVLDKIFEPFFTTKEAGAGTGLGLYSTLGIVKGHGGFVNVYSEIGRGTQFRVYLPAAELPGGADTATDAARPEPGKGELILVVDDELSIREIARITLEAYGYRVLAASDGAEAVAVFAENKGDIRVVVTDMQMPTMDGMSTILVLKKIDPNVKIISSSGLASNEKVVSAMESGVSAFLPKPYTADTLLRTIAELL
jgi:nitrogen-specific signal transduction histidine kinase